MDLLDLPPEIFQKIIASYVRFVGVSEAWERRKVCKTFAAFISEECLGRQPMRKYADDKSMKIVSRHLGLFLEYRCKTSYGAPTFFPTLIRYVVDQFMRATSQSSEKVRAVYTEQACNAIKDCCLNAYNRATNPRLQKVDPIEAHCLVIAIWMKDKELITYYLSGGVSIWEDAPKLRSPIAIATESRAVGIVSQLLEYAKSGLTKTARVESNKDISRVTESAIASEHWDVAIMLIDWWFQHFRKPLPSQIVSWAKKAVHVHAPDFLYRLLDQKLSLAAKRLLVERLYSSYYPWGNASLDLLVGALFDRNLLDIEICHHDNGPFSMSLLARAVANGDIKVAKKCLEAGMSSNGLRRDDGKLEYPLISAVDPGDPAMVKLLLDYDADPKPAQRFIVGLLPQYRQTPFFKEIVTQLSQAWVRQRTKALADA